MVGLGIVPLRVQRFPAHCVVPQQAWSLVLPQSANSPYLKRGFAFYSNSYCFQTSPLGWEVAESVHGGVRFVASMQSGGVVALQFHPELSGAYGAETIATWFRQTSAASVSSSPAVARPLCRVICCMDVKDGRVVKGVKFQNLTDAGDPSSLALQYEKQGCDELVILDVSATLEARSTALAVIKSCRAKCSLPITVGGGVRSLEDATALLEAGADKVALNSAAVSDPTLVSRLAKKFGSQCIVLAIDCKKTSESAWSVMTRSGSYDTHLDAVQWAKQGMALGAGEILLTSLDRDGTREGFDCALLAAIAAAVTIPVVASGGANSAQHFVEAFKAGAAAVLAASIFHFGDTTVGDIKRHMIREGVAVRPPTEQQSVTASSNAKSFRNNVQCVIPCIDIMGGHAVQLVGGKPEELKIDAGDPMLILKKFRVGGEIAIVDLDAALSGGSANNTALIEQLLREGDCRVGGGIRTVEAARKWLDAGAKKVVIGSAASEEFLKQLPRARVVVALDCVNGEVVIHGWKTFTGVSALEKMKQLKAFAGHFLVTFVEGEGKMQGFPMERVAEMTALLAGECQLTIAGGVTTAEEVRALDALGVEAQIGMAMYSGRLPLGQALFAMAKTDEKGLLTTVVTDERDCVLGVCYSSEESFKQAISTLKGVYWSRSRNQLWLKGATSGNTQELLRVAFDCDRDAVKFVVKQNGSGFCHRESVETCFGSVRGLAALEDTIHHRIAELATAGEAAASSYTARLLKSREMLNAKIVEEAAELAEATDGAHIAAELADLIYFSLVKAAQNGVSLAQVERVLDARALKVSRDRPGNAKPKYLEAVGAATAAAAATPATTATLQTPAASGNLLRRVGASELAVSSALPSAVDAAALAAATPVVEDVRKRGLPALLEHAVRLGDIASPDAKVVYSKEDCRTAFDSLPASQQALLMRVAERIRLFALHQKNSLKSTRMTIPGGVCGQNVSAIGRAGIYAPGGRYPLPSSVLMGAVTARVAGVASVVVASPKPQVVTLAAAHVSGADCLLAMGGAQAIAALAYGIPQLPDFKTRCDVVTGPGNKWVTAAKFLVAGTVAIDMLAGPSECLVACDPSSNVRFVAADLLAQAEHDTAARPILVCIGSNEEVEQFVTTVEQEMQAQLATLPTAETAREACLKNGVAVLGCATADAAAIVLDQFAAEHVELHGKIAESLAPRLKHYGALFVGESSAEVFGDYGAGPNHTLPTGGTARSFSGLSVHTFLKKQTFLHLQPGSDSRLSMMADAVEMGLMEGLYGHARAAKFRLEQGKGLSMIANPERAIGGGESEKIKLALPKGRMQDGVLDLLKAAGLPVELKGRVLRPKIKSFPEWDIKMLKPRNVVEM